MADLIDRDVAIDALDALCDRECEYSKKQRSVMCGACHLGSAFDVIEQMPSAQTTLYGYKIEHLAYIATVMQKKKITAEKAVEIFSDIRCVATMLIEEIQNKVDKEIERWAT